MFGGLRLSTGWTKETRGHDNVSALAHPVLLVLYYREVEELRVLDPDSAEGEVSLKDLLKKKRGC